MSHFEKENIEHSKLVIFQLAIGMSMLLISNIYHIVKMNGFQRQICWVLTIAFVCFIILVIHYFLAKKYKLAASSFAMI